MNKICLHCGLEFQKPTSLAYWQWETQKYCSQKCNARHKDSSGEYRRTNHSGKKRVLHRVLMEQHLGRELSSGEVVHHINGDKHDNRIENLIVMTHKEHSQHHNQKHPVTSICVVCGNEFTPLPTKRGRTKTCGVDCKKALLSISNSKLPLPGSYLEANK